MIKLFLREIRIEHTLFALPFAYVGAVLGARGLPSWPALLWITLAVVGARTAAMAANRYFDRDIDARNPRTARRALATGALSPAVMLWAIALGLVLLLLSAWILNPLCVKLLPIAAVGVLVYPLCKRFTWLRPFRTRRGRRARTARRLHRGYRHGERERVAALRRRHRLGRRLRHRLCAHGSAHRPRATHQFGARTLRRARRPLASDRSARGDGRASWRSPACSAERAGYTTLASPLRSR